MQVFKGHGLPTLVVYSDLGPSPCNPHVNYYKEAVDLPIYYDEKKNVAFVGPEGWYHADWRNKLHQMALRGEDVLHPPEGSALTRTQYIEQPNAGRLWGGDDFFKPVINALKHHGVWGAKDDFKLGSSRPKVVEWATQQGPFNHDYDRPWYYHEPHNTIYVGPHASYHDNMLREIGIDSKEHYFQADPPAGRLDENEVRSYSEDPNTPYLMDVLREHFGMGPAEDFKLGSLDKLASQILYHVSPRRNREAIMDLGLQGQDRDLTGTPWNYTWGQPQGNYFFSSPEAARQYAYVLQQRAQENRGVGGFNFPGDNPEHIHENLPGRPPGWRPEPDAEFDDNYDDPEMLTDDLRWMWDDHAIEKGLADNDPNGWDIHKVHVTGLPIFLDPETMMFLSPHQRRRRGVPFGPDEDLGKVHERQEGEYDENEDYGMRAMRFMVPQAVSPQRIQLHEHVPTWNMTGEDYEGLGDEDHRWEVPEPWLRLPYSEIPMPGHESRTADFNQCFNNSTEFVKRNGGEVVQVAGYKGDLGQADPRWQELDPSYIHHYLVRMEDGTFIDVAPRQFGHDHATRPMSEDEVRALWSKAYRTDSLSAPALW